MLPPKKRLASLSHDAFFQVKAFLAEHLVELVDDLYMLESHRTVNHQPYLLTSYTVIDPTD